MMKTYKAVSSLLALICTMAAGVVHAQRPSTGRSIAGLVGELGFMPVQEAASEVFPPSAVVAQAQTAAHQAAPPVEPTPQPAPHSPPVVPEYDMIVAVIKPGTHVHKSLGANCGDLLSEGYKLSNQMVIYVRSFKCTTTYGNHVHDMAEVYYRGSRYLIRREGLILDNNSTARNDALTDAQVQLLRGEFENDSHILWTSLAEDALKAIARTKAHGIAVLNRRVYDESDYTNGTGFRVKVLNTSQKTIKYVAFSIVGYNAVGDPVRDGLKRSTGQTMRGIGPIKPNESASYSFEYIWHTDVVEYVRLTKLKVDYMDGTSNVVAFPEKTVVLDDSVERFLDATEAP